MEPGNVTDTCWLLPCTISFQIWAWRVKRRTVFFSFIRVHCACVEFAFHTFCVCVCIVNQLFFSNKTKSKSNIEAHVDTHRCVGQPIDNKVRSSIIYGQPHEPCRSLWSGRGAPWRKSLAPRYSLLTCTSLETWLILWEGCCLASQDPRSFTSMCGQKGLGSTLQPSLLV